MSRTFCNLHNSGDYLIAGTEFLHIPHFTSVSVDLTLSHLFKQVENEDHRVEENNRLISMTVQYIQHFPVSKVLQKLFFFFYQLQKSVAKNINCFVPIYFHRLTSYTERSLLQISQICAIFSQSVYFLPKRAIHTCKFRATCPNTLVFRNQIFSCPRRRVRTDQINTVISANYTAFSTLYTALRRLQKT